jgi:radical SAM protein with 4Fe4S-binding SPASM domain
MCQLSRRSFHDLRAGSFEEGWSTLFPSLRAREWRSNAVCRRCTLLPLCGNCPGAAELETGDLESVVERFCEITHAQAFAARGDVPGHRRDAACCLGPAREPLIQIQRRAAPQA